MEEAGDNPMTDDPTLNNKPQIPPHTHMTRDIKSIGKCPGCDARHHAGPDSHVIEWVFDSGWVKGKLICNAPPLSQCKLQNDDCECEVFWGLAYELDGRPYHYDAPEGEERNKHYMTYGDWCGYEVWINESDIEELQHTEKPVKLATTPVSLHWMGDYMEWDIEDG